MRSLRQFKITRRDLRAATEATSTLADDDTVLISRVQNGVELLMLAWHGATPNGAIIRWGEVIELKDFDGLEREDFADA